MLPIIVGKWSFPAVWLLSIRQCRPWKLYLHCGFSENSIPYISMKSWLRLGRVRFGNRFWENLHVQDLSRIFPPELLEVPAKFNRHKKEQRQTFSWYRMHLNGLSKQQRSRCCNYVRSASKTLSIDAFPFLPFKIIVYETLHSAPEQH